MLSQKDIAEVQAAGAIAALVFEVIAQVYELSGRRSQPWYIDGPKTDLRSLQSKDFVSCP